MNKQLLKVIRERREEHEIHGKDEDKYDLLDIMLTTKLQGTNAPMNDELVRANLMTILSAGHSTTTAMLSWTCNFLYDSSLGNRDSFFEILTEIKNISGDDRRYIPNLNDIYKNLNFLTWVLKESLRLCPPIPTIVRHCKRSTNLGGYYVKKGETVMISCLGTHLNPKSWDNAAIFDPSRFKEINPHPCAFIPWAGGPRQCIGREFALLTGRLAMFLLLNQYHLELSPKANVREDEHLFVFPEGLLVNAQVRTDMIKKLGDSSSSTSKKVESDVKSEKKMAASSGARAWEGLKALIREKGYQVSFFFLISISLVKF